MNIIRNTGAAALIAVMMAGSANAGLIQPLSGPWAEAKRVFAPSPTSASALGWIGGTFALWTFGRFLNNCGPFRCSK